MKIQPTASLGILTLVLANCHCVLADPLLNAVTVTAQSPKPVCRGDTAAFVVTMTKVEKGNLEVYLTATGLPTGATATFSPNPIRFSGDSKTSATASLLIDTSASTPPGLNPFSVIAAAGGTHNTRTNSGTLEVTLCSPGAGRMPNGVMCLAFESTPGLNCRIEATTDLTPPALWTTLCTTNSGTNSLLVFADLDSTNHPIRFYRTATE